MGRTCSIVSLVLVVGIGLIAYFILRDGELPEIKDQFWGSQSASKLKEDESVRPFSINISEKILKDLNTRLTLEVATLDERIVDTLEGAAFEYGFNKNFLKKVTHHWLNKYDWRQREKALNKYPSFKTKISGLDIHFQHVKSPKKFKGGSRPLLLLHGWPGSFVEYQKMIPLLVDPKDSEINFEVKLEIQCRLIR
jgi:microsomal epoxide hydrolase